jgi:arylsulfatase A-like enzyme
MVILSLVLLSACQPPKPPAPTHLVVICLDTVRFDSFFQTGAVEGNAWQDELTPWLESAQVYRNAMATAPWTIPSVSSLLTGLYPIEHAAGQFEGEVANLDTGIPSALDEGVFTLAEIMASQYFRTGAFVSHPFFAADLGLDQGFQQVHNRQGWWKDVEQFWKWADRIKEPNRSFAYLHFMEAHHRHTRSTGELEKFLEAEDEAVIDHLMLQHPGPCADPDSRRCKQTLVYGSSVLELRRAVAAVLQGLQDRQLLDKTLVLLYSDHGEEFWDHEAEQTVRAEDPRGNYGLGHGQSMYQELLHIPLIAWHPGIKGKQHTQLTSLIDALPSIVEWMDLNPELPGGQGESETQPGQTLAKIAESWSGVLLPPLSRGRKSTHPVFASGIAYGPERIATRMDSDKSVYAMRDQSYRFFDLASDPAEQQPLDSDALVLAFDTLTGDYLELTPFSASSGAGGERQLSSEQLEQLKSIGYLQGVEEPSATEDPDDDGIEIEAGESPIDQEGERR